jgi:hypothetical protein
MAEHHEERLRQLQEARAVSHKKIQELKVKIEETKKLTKEVGTLAKSVTPWGFVSLLGEMNLLTDWTYGLAFFAAVLKDILDFTGFGSLPLIGTVITFCVSIFIGFMMLLSNILGSERSMFQRSLMRWLVLITGTLVELLFGLNFIPWETATVLFVYAMALAARKNDNHANESLAKVEKQVKPRAADDYYEEDYANAA